MDSDVIVDDVDSMNKTSGTMRGAMIVLEGLDRSGKTTQSHKLVEHLMSNGRKARIQRFPDRAEPMIGPLIDSFLKTAKSVNESQEVIHLLFAANRWEMAERMREDLANGTSLIVDRYSFSGIAYSLLVSVKAKGLERTWVCHPEVGLPKPDLVLFFDVDPSQTRQRDGFGDEVMERNDFQQLVYAKMQSIRDDSYWKTIDASASIEDVHVAVVKEAEKVIGRLAAKNANEPIETFTKDHFQI